MNDIAVFSFGRKQSERCPNKMLRPFAGTTLTDIVLGKLARLGSNTFFAGYEDEFRVKCEAHGVRFVRRDARSIGIDEPIVDILSFLRDEPATCFLIVSGCVPFITVDQIMAFRDRCIAGGCRPGISVRAHRSHFLSSDRVPVNFDLSRKTLNTKTLEPVFEIVGALFFFDKDFFFEHGSYWDWKDVQFIDLASGPLKVDIDTEEDFAMAEALWGRWEGTAAERKSEGRVTGAWHQTEIVDNKPS